MSLIRSLDPRLGLADAIADDMVDIIYPDALKIDDEDRIRLRRAAEMAVRALEDSGLYIPALWDRRKMNR